MKRKAGWITLGMVAALVAIVLAVAQLGGGSSGGGVIAPEDAPTDLTVELDAARGQGDELPLAELEGEPGASSFGGGERVAPPLPDLAGRKLVRNATVSLEVEDVGAAVRQVERIAAGAGGFVSASNVFVEDPPEPVEDGVSPPERTESATVTIRVPSAVYSSVLNQLRDIAGEVRSESSTTADVTEEFTDLEARKRNLEATEVTYLALLEKAETVADILTVQERINDVRLEIELIEGRINLLNDLSDLATIIVQLRPPLVVEAETGEAGWAQEAWENAWEGSQEVLEAMGTAAIVGGVVLAWIAVPGLVVLVVWRLFGPRRPRGGEAGGTGSSA